MRRVKVSTYSGSVLETEIYNVSDRGDARKACPRLRFRTDEDRRAHRDGISRRRFVRLVNNSFTPHGWYCTLTFSPENEVHDFRTARRIRDNFVRRLTYRYPAARIVVVMGRGENTHRIHYHMIAEGLPASAIREQWRCGDVIECEHLREHNIYDGIDCGADYTGLANYLWAHWTPEQSGHRYKATRTCVMPKPDEPEICIGHYGESKHPAAPKGYIYVGCQITAYGFMRFKYVRDPAATSRRRRR